MYRIRRPSKQRSRDLASGYTECRLIGFACAPIQYLFKGFMKEKHSKEKNDNKIISNNKDQLQKIFLAIFPDSSVGGCTYSSSSLSFR